MPWSIRNLLRRDLLKENVDGEALLWAAQRLRNRPETRKFLVVISDGAPVDDSTFAANGPDILDHHLTDVIASIKSASDIRLAGIGLDYELSGYYPEHAFVRSNEDLARVVGLIAASLQESSRQASQQVISEG